MRRSLQAVWRRFKVFDGDELVHFKKQKRACVRYIKYRFSFRRFTQPRAAEVAGFFWKSYRLAPHQVIWDVLG